MREGRYSSYNARELKAWLNLMGHCHSDCEDFHLTAESILPCIKTSSIPSPLIISI
jgi:hypothetical protein